MIEIIDLSKRYHYRKVLSSLSMTVQAGEAVGIVGRNGSGKTTLLRIIAGLSSFQSGRVRIAGWDVVRDPLSARSCTGFLSHQPRLYPELTAAENLLFFSRIHALKLTTKQIHAALDSVGLLDWKGERTGRFSRGMLQRLALVRTCFHAPEVLLLDEPAAGLDVEGGEMLLQLIQNASDRGGAVLVTSHNPDQMGKMDRILELEEGQVSPREDRAHPRTGNA